MSLKEILDEAERIAIEAMKTDPKKIKLTEIPNSQGVYLFYRENQVIYIGQGKQLRRRLGQHLSDGKDVSKSAFRRALGRNEFRVRALQTKAWILKNCSLATIEIENPDICVLVESLLIAYFRRMSKVLLNH